MHGVIQHERLRQRIDQPYRRPMWTKSLTSEALTVGPVQPSRAIRGETESKQKPCNKAWESMTKLRVAQHSIAPMNLDSSAENRGTWCRWTNGHLQRTKNQNADRPCHAAWGNGTLQDPGAQYCFKRAGESPEVKYIQLSSPFSTSPTSAFSERQFRSHENSEIPMWFPWDCKCSRSTQHTASNGSVQWFPRNSNPHGSRPVTVQPISTLLSYPVIPSHTQSYPVNLTWEGHRAGTSRWAEQASSRIPKDCPPALHFWLGHTGTTKSSIF